MKNLLKSSFRSFFKSKLALALLTIIVFVSASVFTMMHSASKTFNDSYNTIMTQGKAHEFTMDEQYSTTGSFDTDLIYDSDTSLNHVDAIFNQEFLDIYSKNIHDVTKHPKANKDLPEETNYLYFTQDEARSMGIKIASQTRLVIDPVKRAEADKRAAQSYAFGLSLTSFPKTTINGNIEAINIDPAAPDSNFKFAPVRVSISDLQDAVDWEKFVPKQPLPLKKGATFNFQPLMRQRLSGQKMIETNNVDRDILKGLTSKPSSKYSGFDPKSTTTTGESLYWGQEQSTSTSTLVDTPFTDFSQEVAKLPQESLQKIKTNPYKLNGGPSQYAGIYTGAIKVLGIKAPSISKTAEGIRTIFTNLNAAGSPVKSFKYYRGFTFANINSMDGAYKSVLQEAKTQGARMSRDESKLLCVPSFDTYKGVIHWNNPLPSISVPVTATQYAKTSANLLADKADLADIKSSGEYNTEISRIKSSFQTIALRSKREDLLAQVETDFSAARSNAANPERYSSIDAKDIYSYKDLSSIALSDGDKRYKIVNTLDNDKVDSVYLNEGSLPLEHGDNEKVFESIVSQVVAELTGGQVSLMHPTYSSAAHYFTAFTQATGQIAVQYDGPASAEDLPTGNWKVRLNKQGKTQNILLRNDKKYKISASWTENVLGNLVPKVVSAVDPSAFQVVVSPSYAYANGLTVINRDKALIDANGALFNNDPEGYAAANPKTSILVGSTVYQIVGIGTTPDFMYPIISQQAPVPDTTHEAIIFTRAFGFESFHDAYRSATQENYLAFGFNEKATEADKALFFKTIKEDANKEMSLSGRDAVIAWDDTSGSINMSAYRMTPLNTIMKTIDTVSWLFPVFTIVIAAIIVIMIIRTQISGMRKEFGILVANGYAKRQIAGSMMTIALIVGLSAGIFGYIAGHFLQFAFIHAFNNYWTIPVTGQGFSWVSLVIISAWPVLGIALFSFLVTLFEMRASVVAMLSGAKTSSTKWIASLMMKPFRWFGIKTKMTVSIFSNNLMKMTLSMLGFGLAITTTSLAISTMGKFTYAKNKSLENYHYQYKVDLTSPTTEGGLYGIINPSDIYMPTVEEIKNATPTKSWIDKFKKNQGTDPKTHINYYGKQFFHIPSKADQDVTSLTYLKNRVQFKSLLNATMGAAGVGTNPWAMATALMPTNQANEASQKNIRFLKFLVAKNMEKVLSGVNGVQDSEIVAALNSLKTQLSIDIKGTEALELKGDYKDVAQLKTFDAAAFSSSPIEAASSASGTISLGYYALVKDAFEDISKDLENHPENQKLLPMLISYGNFIGNAPIKGTTNKGNEHYTHIDASSVLKDRKGIATGETFSITGFQKSSTAVTKQALWDKVNKYVQDNHLDVSKSDTEIPVIVNKYFSYKFRKEVGDTFKANVINHKDRFLKATTNGNIERTFKVIAIDETYNDAKILTTQQVANEVLGWGTNSAMFNGVFSNDDSPLIVQELNFYSQSSIYPSVDKIIKDDHSFDNYKLADGSKAKNIYDQLDDKSNPIHGELGANLDGAVYTKLYGDSPFRFSYENVDWFQISNATFENITKLSSTIIWTIMAIVLFISLLFILMLSAVIIRQARKFIATLKVLGYRTREIRRIYLSSFIVPAIIALGVTIPAANFLSVGMQEVVMRFGNVLVPFSMTGWEIAVAAVIVISLFVTLFVLGVRSLKNTSLTQAFV